MTKLGRFALIGLAAAGGAACTGPQTPPANAGDASVARNPAAETGEKGKYDVEMAQADGNHQISVRRCEVLVGVQAKACRAQADADYEMLKSIAKTQYPDLASAR